MPSTTNIGNDQPVGLLHFIEVLEQAIGKHAKKTLLPIQPGDIPATYADIEDLSPDVGFKPMTPFEVGIPRSCSGIGSATRSEQGSD